MSLVNNSGKVISNNSSTSSVSSSSTSTTKKSSAASSAAGIGVGAGPALANANIANLNRKAQESISTSSSSEVHFEEEDTPLTPPAISFTTLITDYETELMAFIDNETSRTPSPQPQPDLLIDIQRDEDAANGNGNEVDGHAIAIVENENGLGLGLGLELPKSLNANVNANMEALIDESAKMVINNKNLLLHDLQLQQMQDGDGDGDEDDLSLMNDYQEHDNSLTSTTTLDTVIAVGDLAPVPAAPAQADSGNRLDHNSEFNSLEQGESGDEHGEDDDEQREHDEHDSNNHLSSNGHHYFDEQESSVDDSLTQLQTEEQEPIAAEAADVGDNNKFHEKQQESVIIKSSSSSKKSSSSTSSSSFVKQSSVEKVQQQGKQVKETIKQSGTTAQESITMNMTNGGPANIEATASVDQVKETTRVNDEGVVKQKKKNSSQSISVHEHDMDDEHDKPSDCATNNNNALAKANGNIGNGFHSKNTNLYNNNKNADATRNMNERNRNNSKDHEALAPAPVPQHELDDNEVFNFVSVSKLKSSFTKFDNLARGASDVNLKRVEGKNQAGVGSPQQESPLDKKPNEHICKCCGKTIFIMELVRAEKEDWHKHCFRCTICKKSLAADNYCSNEGILYCKPHFRELFQPKPVLETNGETEEDEETRRKKRSEIIIRESEPVQLPPDVVKSTVDDTSQRFAELEELNKNLDVKSKFQVFQTLAVGQDQEQQPIEPVKRSSSAVLASRVAKYQSAVEAAAKMEATSTAVGVSDADLGIIPPGGIQEGNGNEDSDDEAATVKLMTKKLIPADEINFEAVDSVRSKWEQNSFAAKAHKEEARKEEQIRFRSKLLHGKSNQLKEMYEKAVVESTASPAATSPNPAQLVEEGEVYVAKAKELKEKFESVSDDAPGAGGDPTNKAAMLKDEIFESEITKSSRNMFKELDKSASSINFQQNANTMAKSESKTAMARHQHSFEAKDIVRSSDVIEEVVAPSDISNKFQFFEKYTDEQQRQKEKEKKQFRFTPPREGQVKEPSPDVEIYRDPNIVRACDNQVDAPPNSNTASKMLSVFRQLEAAEHQQKQHDSYKPLKEFTPPRETRSAFANGNGASNGGGDEYDYDSEDEQTHLNNSHGSTVEKDEILKQMGSLARASSLRAKFEVWNDSTQDNGDSEDEGDRHGHEQQNGNGEVIAPSIDTTKNLRAKFERINELEEMALNNKKEAFNKRPVKRFV